MKRRDFLKLSGLMATAFAVHGCAGSQKPFGNKEAPRPNILFCLADDWGWPHAGAYGDPVVKTPTFDQLLFLQSYSRQHLRKLPDKQLTYSKRTLTKCMCHSIPAVICRCSVPERKSPHPERFV